MKNNSRFATSATAAALSLAAAVACRNGGAPPTGSGTTVFSSVDTLVPGSVAVIRGRGFGAALASVTVDGATAPIRRRSDTEAEFTVPLLRECDVDQRRVRVRDAGESGASIEGVVRVPAALQLAVGESRRLQRADLSCLQLPGADHDYVLTALNPSTDPVQRTDVLFTLRSYAGAASAPAVGVQWAATLLPARHGNGAPHAAMVPPGYGAAPVLFDSRYATAQSGDTVRFVDWERAACTPASKPDRATVPWYPAVVLAASEPVVIALDLRHPNAGMYLSAEARPHITDAARIAGAVLVATMREVFDADFDPLPAAGGRSFHIIAPPSRMQGASGLAFDGQTVVSQAYCPVSSEMVVTLVSGGLPNSRDQARALASVIVHEYAHNAEMLTKMRAGTYLTSASVWTAEPWAVLAEETAARIASGQPNRAQIARLGDQTPSGGTALNTLWGLAPTVTPYTGSGVYTHGAALLMYARERSGDASIGSPGPRTFGRLSTLRRMDVDSVARILGTSAAQLLDDFTLAHATDDLVDQVSAQARGLPQLQTWDTADRARDLANGWGPRGGGPGARPDRTLPRRTDAVQAVAAAPGNYFAAYVMADGMRGITLTGEGFTDAPSVIRITRLR